jgi:uncharacterized protein YndB with AHSA1/START domain
MTERRKVVVERTYDASPPEVWEMWTTSHGIESWWGPDGFEVEVHVLDVRPGGRLSYSMKTVGAEHVEYMKQSGLPLVTTLDVVYTEVNPFTRLSYTNVVDFIPDVDTYEAGTTVELTPTATGTHLKLILEAMHDEEWTGRAVAGWENELERLRHALETRKEQS